MKIKRSVLKKILKNALFNLENINKKVKRFKNKMKKGVKGLLNFNNSVMKEYETQLEKIGMKSDIVIYSKEDLEFYLDDCNGNLVQVTFEEAIKSLSKEVKEVKKEIKQSPIIKNQIVDEYAGKKFIISEMIKSVYFKAKELVITINGILLKANEEYRKTIDRFLEIRTMIRDKSYYMIKENNFLLKFVLDNDIKSDDEFDSCLDILTKMYIIEREQLLYKDLSKFSQLS